MSDELFTFQPELSPRWFSPENPTGAKGAACLGDDGRKRRPAFPLKAGESATLAEVTGTGGTIRRIWITISERHPAMLRGLRLDLFWDGAPTPAVSVPLGDFFGHALGQMISFENALFSSPEGRSFNSIVPMPFRTGMKAVVTNESGSDLGMLFYDIDVTLGDSHGPGALYFHAHWRRENPTTILRDYELLPKVTGQGRFLGVTVGVVPDRERYSKTWWGEGEVKLFLDGDTAHATLCGTGTEDYIGTGWGQGQYAQRYQGCPLADHGAFRYGFYRLHLPDPIFFGSDCRATIQQIGCWDPDTIAQLRGQGRELFWGDQSIDMAAAVAARGYGLFERQDDWSSVAYFYLDRPENGLPPLVAPVVRIG